MDVAELAKDLEVPPSAVLEACSALDIEGAWAGAEVSAVDEVRLRARLASGVATSGDAAVADGPAPLAPTGPVADELEGELVGATAGTAAAGGPTVLPPTAVGSHPGMVEEFSAAAADVRREEALAGLGRTGPVARAADVPSEEADVGRQVKLPARDRHFDPSIRPSVIALVLAAAAAVGGNALDVPALILPCWLAVAVLLVVSLISANRARYRITTHPDRKAGLPVAIAALVLALLGMAAFGGAIWTVLRPAPAAQAPLGLGDVASVQHMRWGYQRLRVIEDTGWERPAKDAGTCWRSEDTRRPRKRREHRIEQGGPRVACTRAHLFEVVQVISVNQDADAPYPGVDSLQATGAQRCSAVLGEVAPKGSVVLYEHPDAEGWAAGDHDVACVVMASRSSPLRA